MFSTGDSAGRNMVIWQGLIGISSEPDREGWTSTNYFYPTSAAEIDEIVSALLDMKEKM